VKFATMHFLKQVGDNARYRMIDVSLRIEKPQGMKQIPSRKVQVVLPITAAGAASRFWLMTREKYFTMKCFRMSRHSAKKSGPRRGRSRWAMNASPSSPSEGTSLSVRSAR
jgi:hypothetical protein